MDRIFSFGGGDRVDHRSECCGDEWLTLAYRDSLGSYALRRYGGNYSLPLRRLRGRQTSEDVRSDLNFTQY